MADSLRAATDTLLYRKTLGCLLDGIIGDAMGTPTECLEYGEIEARFGWVDDFSTDGTDDTAMKTMLAEALIHTGGCATLDDWAEVWLERWGQVFGSKRQFFFVSVLHTAEKLRRHTSPRMAALGNMPSSSSAMCISPVGIVNACRPMQAALQAYNLASLIHVHDVGFCQDGAASMAAAVAEAMKAESSVDSVLDSAVRAIAKQSGWEMLERIERAVALARSSPSYEAFREAVYAQRERFFCELVCDARETVPLALAILVLADGDVGQCVTYSANLGRDADTIATMSGAIAGALRGVEGIRSDWVAKAIRLSSVSQEDLAARLVQAAQERYRSEQEGHALFEKIVSA